MILDVISWFEGKIKMAVGLKRRGRTRVKIEKKTLKFASRRGNERDADVAMNKI